MADESKESSKPSWKRKKAATPAPGTPRRASASRYAWTQRREKTSDDIGVPRTWLLRLLAVGAAFAACIVGLVILILMIRLPEPAAVVLVKADYATNLSIPHNIPGKKGVEAIQALARAPRSFTLFNSPSLRPVLESPYVLDRRTQWSDLIKDLETRDISEKTVIFVLALHGLSDNSQAYLLPNLATSPEDALPLVDVIESMKSQKLKGKNKILILEGAGIPSDWHLGMLKNEFAARLRDLESKIEEVDRLWVLSASDVDQRCWTSEGLGTSIFFHFLAESLKGNGTGIDRRLDLNELHAYLARNVKDWVWHARAAIQEPVLLPESRSSKFGKESKAVDANHPLSKDVYLASASPETEAVTLTPNKTLDRERLKAAWASFQRLGSQTPHPSVYSPTLWRIYRASLVRCEELVHSGEPAEAEYLLGRLKAFEGRLASERPLKLSKSAQNSLAMNAVQGGSIGDLNPPPQLIEFWQATRPDQLKKIWQDLKNSGPSSTGEQTLAGLMPRERAITYLLGRAISSDGASGNLEKVAERIRVINDEEIPLPSEAHFLRMLSNKAYLPLAGRSTEFQSLVTQAIALRLQAERSALGVKEDQAADEFSYCEQIHPWISQLVGKADISRRKAEDLLFATEDQAAKDVGKAIASAKEQYQVITSRAQAVRSALAVRDGVFAELPEYCRWLPHRHARDIADEKLAEKVRNLWPQVHELAAKLEQPSPASEVSDIARKAKDEVLAEIEAVKKKFIDQQHEYDSDRQPEDWEAAMAAVAVPFFERGVVVLRETIWDRLDTIRQKDIALAAKLEPVAISEDDVKKKLGDLRSRAVLEAQMAISVLGQEWYDGRQFSNGVASQFAIDSELIEKAEKTDKDWRQTLATVGGRIGTRIRGIETRIAELVSKPEHVNAVSGARERLPEAVRLARCLDSRASLPIKDDSSPHPALSLRRFRGHELLNWLAERAWLDHWYGENPRDLPPYFSEIGTRFIADAQELFPKSSDSMEKQKLFAIKSGLAFDEPEPILFTSERKRAVTYHLVEDGKVPDGIPVVKAEIPTGLTVEETHAGEYRMAARRTVGGGGSQSIAFTLSSSLITETEPNSKLLTPRVESVNFGVRGFFRGQVFERRTGVEIDPVPEISIKGPGLPEPPLASIAVQADQRVVDEFGGGNGAIAVVLDCSGSMKSGEGGTSKIDEARRSLVRVLEKLPPKTRLSIWIFGQAADGFVDEQHARDIDVRQNQNPWETIRPLREAAPWDPADLEPLRKKFDAIIPFHPTPLLQAMWGAKLDLDKAQGLKTMLVLTDGADDQFDKNLTFNPNRVTIPAFIRENFKNAGIMINMILFKLGQSGEKEARSQFEVAITQLEPSGHVFTARDEEKLLETLQRSIKRDLTCTITGSDGKTIGELPVTSPDQVTSWWVKGVGPGAYTLKVQANRLFSKEIDLEKGERLIVRLVSAAGGIGFERGSYSNPDTFPQRKETGNAGGWRFSVARTRFEENDPVGALHLFTVLEPANGDMPRLRQVYPGFVWFEIAPQAGAGSFAARWQELDGYPAPVWRADIPQWLADTSSPGPASPIVKTWWLGDKDSSKSVSLDPVEFQDRIQNVKDLEVRSDDGVAITIESIGVEPNTLRTRSDQEPSEVSCLVVRLRYPVGKPCFVDPSSLGKIVPRGYEHRFYTRAGAYTGIFGPVAETEVEELRSMRIIPVARLKERAEARKQVAELKLAQPKGDDKTPLPRSITVGH